MLVAGKFLISETVKSSTKKESKTAMIANLKTGKIYRAYKHKLGKVKNIKNITIESFAVTEINRTFANLDNQGKQLARVIKEVAKIKNTKLDRTFKY